MEKQPVKLRVPVVVGDIQVNFCKNPACAHFGIPASNEKQSRGRGAKTAVGKDRYNVESHGKLTPLLVCSHCKERPFIKSNQAIHEELARFGAFLDHPGNPRFCPTLGCQNATVPFDAEPRAYWRHTPTVAGNARYRCKRCRKVFTVVVPDPNKKPAWRQTVHGHKNFSIFKQLVTKAPLRSICEVNDIPYKSLLDHIAFIHKQCVAFSAAREQSLPGMDLGDLYLSVDRQDYRINWSRTDDKRNVVLHGVGCADQASSYVFAMHLDFDPSVDIEVAEKAALEHGDATLPLPFRRHARLWLTDDYRLAATAAKKRSSSAGSIMAAVDETYQEAANRTDVEAFDRPSPNQRLPAKGMQVHAEYTLYGHFFFLRRLLAGARRLVFYLDQESGIRAACLAAFMQDVRDRRCEAFYVRVNKELTIHEKHRRRTVADSEMQAYVDIHPYLATLRVRDVRLHYLKEKLAGRIPVGPWRDEWLDYPFPDMSEPEKAICWLTDRRDGGTTDDELAEMFLRGTLHPIDRFFMQIRRKLSPLERSIFSSSSSRRAWHAYAPYNPIMAVWLLDIYRTYYNFVKVGKDHQTPAMRIGLAKAPVPLKDVIYFTS